VPYYTSAISKHDPFRDIINLNLSYFPSYAPTVVDPTHPLVALATPKKDIKHNQRRLLGFAIVILLPLWASIVIIVSLYQNYVSAQRIRQHVNPHHEKNSDKISSPADKSVSNGAGVVQDVFEGHVDSGVSPSDGQREYFTGMFPENGDAFNQSPTAYENRVESATTVTNYNKEEYLLPLSEDELAMISGLRGMSWSTFGVHIHKTMRSHAAIIQRRKGLGEGTVVIQHWLDTQFEV